MELISNHDEDSTNQHKNSDKVRDEVGHPLLILTKNQWKLDNNIIGISQWKKSHFRINGRISRNK